MKQLLKDLEVIIQLFPICKPTETSEKMDLARKINDLYNKLADEQERQDKFFYKLAEMRREQVNYFAAAKQKDWTKAGPALKNSRLLEKEIDAKLAEIKAGASQTQLF